MAGSIEAARRGAEELRELEEATSRAALQLDEIAERFRSHLGEAAGATVSHLELQQRVAGDVQRQAHASVESANGFLRAAAALEGEMAHVERLAEQIKEVKRAVQRLEARAPAIIG
mmetsp:Transcript_4270/g.13634  ORF Transcript_4270/g.13634 Transcript_4270/m.13634 type:complete len:116 (-) Transcript_4270:1190-1537(-)